ncbi:MAG TPA: PRC-barrel domain-containing protein [Nitrososphaerales archaeon]|nr:PRC-barrel domain-containing protein [Nitrososphaerales archaeon]
MSGSSSPSETKSATPVSTQTGFMRREDLVGKIIVGQDAMIVGTVKDLVASANGKLALQIERKTAEQVDSSELFVPSDEILGVGDFVLLRVSSSKAGSTMNSPAEQVSQVSAPSPPPFLGKPTNVVCPRCNFSNAQTSRFCVKCGSLLR